MPYSVTVGGGSPTAIQAFGSRPLVTPYYCRLGDLLCLFVNPLFVYYFVCVCICVFFVLFVFWELFSFVALFLQYFDTVGWVF